MKLYEMLPYEIKELGENPVKLRIFLKDIIEDKQFKIIPEEDQRKIMELWEHYKNCKE